MALYPLPPSSNESVIDNGRNVWQVYFKDRLWRLTKAFTEHSLPIEGIGFQWNPRSTSQAAQTMPSVSRMQGRFPGGSASIAKRTRRQSRSIEEEYDFYSFFFLSACSKADGRCKSIRYRTGASACAFNLAFKSSIDIYWLTASACMHLPPWRSGNDPEHFF